MRALIQCLVKKFKSSEAATKLWGFPGCEPENNRTGKTCSGFQRLYSTSLHVKLLTMMQAKHQNKNLNKFYKHESTSTSPFYFSEDVICMSKESFTFWGINKIEGIRGSVLSVSRNSLGQENCLILKQFHCSPQTAMQCKLHDEVEGASRIGAGAQKADHVWMVHLHKRQHVMHETATKISAKACLFLTLCHTITRL